jgi:hypothetical protein
LRLFLSGKKSNQVIEKLSPAMALIKKTLDASIDGELFTTLQLAQLTGYGPTTIRAWSWQLPGYSHKVKSKLSYWGKPKTIKQLKREMK